MSSNGGGDGRVTRRNVLRAMGTGAAGLVATTVGATVGGVSGQGTALAAGPPGPPGQAPPPGRFGRMFRLPPFGEPSRRLTEALLDIGKRGGLLDAEDDLAAGPTALITDPALSLGNPDHPSNPAGTTFVGQFIDHDITFDVASRLGRPIAPESVGNARAPRLDLESVYGGGPAASPQLYDPVDRAKLRIDAGGRFEDLPRMDDGSAIIADPRNDQSIMLGGLHCAVILFHNRCVERVRSEEGVRDDRDAFAAARRLTTWHFQWLVLHEVVPSFVGARLTEEILADGRSFYRPADAFIPVEFQAGAYRMGHSLVRPSYRANLGWDDQPAFFGMIFDPSLQRTADPDDLMGGCRAPRRFVGWQTFFDFDDGEVRRTKRIDTNLSTPLFDLPLFAIATGEAPTVLAQRTLLRHVTWMLPCGQAIAEAMGQPVLPSTDLAELRPYGLGLESSTPLFYYVLKEAELMAGGAHLGPVGGRIVGEVLIGLLQLDPDSFLSRPGWSPSLPRRGGAVTGPFGMTDFLAFAGVDPASRGE